MSGEAADTMDQFFQFVAASDADYVTRGGKLVIDDPEIRQRLVRAMDSYTAVYRKGCTPPELGDLGRCRQQQGVPGPDGHHDTEHDTLDPGCAEAREALVWIGVEEGAR